MATRLSLLQSLDKLYVNGRSCYTTGLGSADAGSTRRKHEMRIWGYVFGLMLIGSLVNVAGAQQIDSIKVRDSIYMLTGKSGNIGVLLGEDGTVKGMIAAVDMMLALANDATRIIPGHGPLASKEQLREYRDMLAIVQERLGKLKAAGKTTAQAVAEKPLADLDANWGNGMFTSDRWIQIIYDGI